MAVPCQSPANVEDNSSTDRDDPSSTEQSDDLTSPSEEEEEEDDDDDDDDSTTSENDGSSVEDSSDGISSIEGGNDVRQAINANEDELGSSSIISFRPSNERPNISLQLVNNSSIADKLPQFLAQIRAANEELETEKSAGTLVNRRIELDDNDDTIEGEEHIEMNLGLGVLEEKGEGTSTTSESEGSVEDGNESIMTKLLGGRRKRGLDDDDEGVAKKAKIQEI